MATSDGIDAQGAIAALIRYNSPEPCHEPQCPASRDEFDPMDIARRIIEGPVQTLIQQAQDVAR